MPNELMTRPGALALIPHNMAEALQLAEFMARAKTLPAHLQASPGDCLMVIEQAMRWGMSPFAVAQATSSIKGKLMFEGKLVAAAVENSSAIQGQFDYRFSGEGDERVITVSAIRTGETTPREVTVAFKDARTDNAMWVKQPDQQLVYHGTRVWARRWTPAVILGVYSREEMSGDGFEGQTIVGTIEPAVAAPEPPSPGVTDRVKAAEAIIDKPKKRNGWDSWLDKLQEAVDKVETLEQWNAIWAKDTVKDAEAKMSADYLKRFDKIRVESIRRIVPPAATSNEA